MGFVKLKMNKSKFNFMCMNLVCSPLMRYRDSMQKTMDTLRYSKKKSRLIDDTETISRHFPQERNKELNQYISHHKQEEERKRVTRSSKRYLIEDDGKGDDDIADLLAKYI